MIDEDDDPQTVDTFARFGRRCGWRTCGRDDPDFEWRSGVAGLDGLR